LAVRKDGQELSIEFGAGAPARGVCVIAALAVDGGNGRVVAHLLCEELKIVGDQFEGLPEKRVKRLTGAALGR